MLGPRDADEQPQTIGGLGPKANQVERYKYRQFAPAPLSEKSFSQPVFLEREHRGSDREGTVANSFEKLFLPGKKNCLTLSFPLSKAGWDSLNIAKTQVSLGS